MNQMQGPLPPVEKLNQHNLPILWIGRIPPGQLLEQFKIEKVDSLQDCHKYLHSYPCMVLVIDFAEPLQAYDLLHDLNTHQGNFIKVVRADHLDMQWIEQGLRQYSVFSFVQSDLSIIKTLQRAQIEAQHNSTRLSLLKHATRQIRELEVLNESLESIVSERTLSLQNSEKEEADNLQQVRGFIRFLNEVGRTTLVEDLLVLLRKEFRRFHKVGEPVLLYKTPEGKWIGMHTKSGIVQSLEISTVVPPKLQNGSSSAEFTQFLANIFARPFVRPLIFNLDSRESQSYLCVESSMSEKEELTFMDYLGPRMQALSLSLDRILIESRVSQFTYRWERTFDQLQSPIAILDIDYEVVRGNRIFSGKTIRGKCYQVFAREDHTCHGCPLHKAVETGQVHTGNIKIGDRLFEVSSYPIKSASSSQITNVVNHYRDITLSRDLYLRMLQSEKLSALGVLAGNIAHELNNPLTGLRSLAQVLQSDQTVPQQVRSDLQEIDKAAQRSQIIIKNLIEFSHEGEVPRSPVFMDDLVHKTLPLLKVALRNHNLKLDLKSKDKKILVEPHLLQQVIFNLINNACQAMKERGDVRVISRTQGKKVILSVEDQGPGVPEELQLKIFEPFFTTKKEGLGTGLGLSLSKKIINAHAGHIYVKNAEEGGARFVVEIPVMD